MPPAAGRILLVNQYYAPDMAATAQLLTDLGEHLAANGHRVQVLASRGRYMPRTGPALRGRETIGGVDILRVRASDFGRGRAWRRLADYGSFMALALARLVRARRGDTVVVLSTPPLLAVAGLAARRRGARLIYKVEDLYPDVAVRLGVLKSGLVARVLGGLSRRVLAAADRVVALDDGMARALAGRGARADRVHVIPNWADEHAITPKPARDSALRRSLGLADDVLVVGYSGNLGLAHHFDALVEAAATLSARGSPVHFLFTGAGPRAPQIAEAAGRLDNVTLLPYQPRAQLGDTLAASDVHVVSLRAEVEGLLFPSKLAGVLAAGRPVLGMVEPGGSLGQEIAEHQLGWAVGDDADALCRALEEARTATCDDMGVRCRAHFEARYRGAVALNAWARLLA